MVLTACSEDVPVAAPEPSAPASQACLTLARSLPETVSRQERRPTDPSSPLTAAWGDPAITLRCGVPRPAQLTPTSETAEVNGVAWLPVELTQGYRFVTVGRVAYVEVDVPEDYAPEVNSLVDLAAAVSASVPLTEGPSPEPSPS